MLLFSYQTNVRPYRTKSLVDKRSLNQKINRITVDLCSSSLIPPPLPSPSPPHFGLNLMQRLGKGPSPLFRDVGPTDNDSTHLRSEDVPARPSPFQRDVGGSCSLDEGIGEGDTRGRTQVFGGAYST